MDNLEKKTNMLQFSNFIQQICSHPTRSLGFKYAKNACAVGTLPGTTDGAYRAPLDP